jgi:peptidyl-prolyl cis-trans isomerase SurA
MEVAREEVEQTYASWQQNFGQDPKQMDAYLASIGSSPASLKRQIEGRTGLGAPAAPQCHALRQCLGRRSERRAEALNPRAAPMNTGSARSTCRPPRKPRRRAGQCHADREQLQQGGSFVAYARQFSEASTAVGRRRPWLGPRGRSCRRCRSRRARCSPASWSDRSKFAAASRSSADRQAQVLMADPRDAVLSLKQISITFPPGTTRGPGRSAGAGFRRRSNRLRGCGDADRGCRDRREVVNNDQIKARDLPGRCRLVCWACNSVRATPPFGSCRTACAC